MAELCYEYQLQLQFSQPAFNHRFTVKSFPESDERQTILGQETSVSPYAFLSQTRDSFGNLCFYGRADAPHDNFLITVKGKASVGHADSVAEPDPARWGMMKYPSYYTRPGEELRRLAWQLQSAQGELTPLQRARMLMEGVHEAISYQQFVTGVQTTAEQALCLGAGVCQDYAQIMLSLLRMEQIPCRYVVGMLRGEGASHAWVEVLSEGRWYGLDPTNLMEVSDQHIKISHGRDFGDCKLNQGVLLGGGLQTQTVRVSVYSSQ